MATTTGLLTRAGGSSSNGTPPKADFVAKTSAASSGGSGAGAGCGDGRPLRMLPRVGRCSGPVALGAAGAGAGFAAGGGTLAAGAGFGSAAGGEVSRDVAGTPSRGFGRG